MFRLRLSATIGAAALLLAMSIDPDAVPELSIIALAVMAVALALAYDPAMEALVRVDRKPGLRDIGPDPALLARSTERVHRG